MHKSIYQWMGWMLLLSVSLVHAQDQALIEKLQQGGLNIFIRHATTPGRDPVKFNPPTERPHDCSTGSRQLHDDGRAQSRRIGQRIKELNIPIGEVFSSSFCPCEETAKLALGRFTSIFLEEGEAAIFEPGEKPRVIGKMKWD